jgi:FlaA1/EpsC-like NDP-sugar epimerase
LTPATRWGHSGYVQKHGEGLDAGVRMSQEGAARNVAALSRSVPGVRKMYDLGAKRRRWLLASADASAWFLGLAFGATLRYDLSLHIPSLGGLLVTASVAACAQVILGTADGLYRGRWRYASFEGVGALATTVLIIVGGLLVLNLVDGHVVREGVPIMGGIAALAVMLTARYVARLIMDSLRKPGSQACRLLIFGAGHAAEEVIRTMLRDPESPYLPVALLDDDAQRRNRSIMGIPVVGNRYDIAKAKERYEVDTLLIAVRRGSGTLRRELADLAAQSGLTVKVLPSLREVIEGTKKPYQIRQATIEDLLGRREVRTDLSAAAGYLANRRVLVTGAGGSIGSELCRQIHSFGPAELIMLDRDETALHGLQLSLEGHALLDSPNLVLLDIRDRPGVEALFARRRPEVVFHAAALKHLPMLEQHPGEAVMTNVGGTLNVLQAAARHGVDRLVNISTDKAVDPCSVLGYSKRMTERLTAAAGASCPDGTFISVRFGNVLGSRGSVLHTFREQIAANGPITVTDPEVRRFFMTVEESIQLVIQAAAVGSSGEVLVLDMGEPVRIEEVARRMIAESGERIDIVYTGLRQGEKLDEVLFGDDELDRRLHHPMISHVMVPPLHPGRMGSLDHLAPPEVIIGMLRDLCCSTGFRADDDPELIQMAELEIAPRTLNGGRVSSFGESGQAEAPPGYLDGRCEMHRRQSDAQAILACPHCSDSSSTYTNGHGSRQPVAIHSGRTYD